MGNYERLIQQIVSGMADANIAFSDLCNLLLRYGFEMRVSGSHQGKTLPGEASKTYDIEI